MKAVRVTILVQDNFSEPAQYIYQIYSNYFERNGSYGTHTILLAEATLEDNRESKRLSVTVLYAPHVLDLAYISTTYY